VTIGGLGTSEHAAPGHQGPRRHLRAAAGGDAEVVQEPVEQPYGIRDCAFRDPAGNLIRIQELR